MSDVAEGVFFRRDPVVPEVPLVFDSPHSGAQYPADFGYACPLALLRTAEDAYVDELYGAAPSHGATLLGALFPRSYLDVNRALDDLDAALLAEPWPSPLNPGEKTRAGIGLIRRLAKPGIPVYDRKLGRAEVEGRIGTYYHPYHQALSHTCDRLHAKFGTLWHVNCHSMQAVGNANSVDGAGTKRADFVLGDRDGSTCAGEFTEFVAGILRERGYDVRINSPYKGVEIVRLHGRPAENRHSLQIEVNRRLYMNEATLEKNEHWPRLLADITFLVENLAAFTRSKTGAAGPSRS
jgi:N-formylglutamate deformylase